MKVLLDTHALLWALSDDPRLSSKARRLYEDADELSFSVVSLWEIGIKLGLGRPDFKLDDTWWRDVPRSLIAQGAVRLDVEPEHCRAVAHLPLYHRDPFDRLLVAQALSEPFRLLTADKQLAQYSELIMTVS